MKHLIYCLTGALLALWPGLLTAEPVALRYVAVGGGDDLTALIWPGEGMILNPGRDGALRADFTAGTLGIWDARGGRVMDAARMAAMAQTFGGAGRGDTSALNAAQQRVIDQIPVLLESVPEAQRDMALATLLGAVGLTVDDLPDSMGGPLSAGNQTRSAVPAGAVSEPEVILLDEPGSVWHGFETVIAEIIEAGRPVRRFDLVMLSDLPQADDVIDAFADLEDLIMRVSPMTDEATIIPDFQLLAGHGYPVEIEDLDRQRTWRMVPMVRLDVRFAEVTLDANPGGLGLEWMSSVP